MGAAEGKARAMGKRRMKKWGMHSLSSLFAVQSASNKTVDRACWVHRLVEHQRRASESKIERHEEDPAHFRRDESIDTRIAASASLSDFRHRLFALSL